MLLTIYSHSSHTCTVHYGTCGDELIITTYGFVKIWKKQKEFEIWSCKGAFV